VRIVLGLGVGLLISASFLFVFHRNGTSGDAALLRPSDPLPYAMAAAALAAAALLGAYVPARRASKVDPMVALRYE
jgi:ABC-type antimicrobial peptide transport system permease subunit